MSLLAGSIVVCLLLLLSHNSKPETTGKDWKAAYEYCRTQNDSLATIKDVQNNLSKLNGYSPIWSSVRGHFTPWIAYRGCYYKKSYPLSTEYMTRLKLYLENNTVGNCYFECKLKNESYGECVNNVNFFFGLQESMCLCLCDNFIRNQISESDKCYSCGTSLDDGECGGFHYISLYETMDIKISDAHFGGFCLTCRPQSDYNVYKSVLYSIDCNINATGYCVLKDGDVSSLPTTVSTFVSYWRHCKNYNTYMIGTTSPTFCRKDSRVWTGLRKYKIDNFDTVNYSCYIIEIHENTINYKKRICTENYHFLCKRDIGIHFNLSVENVNRTSNGTQTSFTREITSITMSSAFYESLSTVDKRKSQSKTINYVPSFKSRVNKAAIAGASIAGILALTFVAFIVVVMLKRQRLHCLQAEQQQQQANRHHGPNNTTYDDLVVTSQRQGDSHIYTTLTYDN